MEDSLQSNGKRLDSRFRINVHEYGHYKIYHFTRYTFSAVTFKVYQKATFFKYWMKWWGVGPSVKILFLFVFPLEISFYPFVMLTTVTRTETKKITFCCKRAVKDWKTFTGDTYSCDSCLREDLSNIREISSLAVVSTGQKLKGSPCNGICGYNHNNNNNNKNLYYW